MSLRVWGAIWIVVLVGTPASAAGQTASRQAAAVTFQEQHPRQSTGMRIAIDYANPQDATAKPPAVQKVVIKLQPGTVIDTSVPARCGASNAELTATGPGACPNASKVGEGELDLDTGLAGPGRILQNDLTIFNNSGELILLLESKSEPRSRVVARSVIEGTRITTEVTPVPGGPPDGFTAIKRVRLRVEGRTAGEGASRRAFISTPDSCPPDRTWTNTVSFTYRDGASETVSNATPCVGSTGERRDHKAPRIRLLGVPREGCAARDVHIRVLIAERWSGLSRAELWLDGRRVVATSRKRFSRRIRAGRPRLHRVRVVAIDKGGNRASRRVSYRQCGI